MKRQRSKNTQDNRPLVAEKDPPRPKVRKRRHLLQVFVLALAVYFLLPQITALSHSMEVLRQMKW